MKIYLQTRILQFDSFSYNNKLLDSNENGIMISNTHLNLSCTLTNIVISTYKVGNFEYSKQFCKL